MRIAPTVVVAAVLSLPSIAAAQAAAPAGAAVGQAPPAFSLEDLRGKRVTVPDSMAGAHTLVLHFWNNG